MPDHNIVDVENKISQLKWELEKLIREEKNV